MRKLFCLALYTYKRWVELSSTRNINKNQLRIVILIPYLPINTAGKDYQFNEFFEDEEENKKKIFFWKSNIYYLHARSCLNILAKQTLVGFHLKISILQFFNFYLYFKPHAHMMEIEFGCKTIKKLKKML